MHALYLDRSRDARPLPRGLAGHIAHPLRFNLVLFSFVYAAAVTLVLSAGRDHHRFKLD
jgi:hypothetical protein